MQPTLSQSIADLEAAIHQLDSRGWLYPTYKVWIAKILASLHARVARGEA